MKHFLFALILLLVSYGAHSQDIIVTKDGDTITCQITRVSDDFIHFSVFDKSGILLMRSRLPLSEVESYEQTDIEPDVESNSNEPGLNEQNRLILPDFKLATFRLALNAGYTYQFGGYEAWPDSYQKQLQSLWNVGGDFHYFPSEVFGVGIKYNYIFTKAEQDFDPQRYGISSIRDEKIRFSYAALSLMYRNILADDQMIHYFIAGGFVQYKSDGLLDGNPYNERGDTFGVALGVAYDFLVTESVGIGAGAEINIANLSEIESNGTVIPVDFSITRIDLTVGLRFLK
ncbi:hypothetical protein [Ekhidna sp.]|uniref:hypothetical protein n=1 Tax=Ekhidna sp. TaxID=2608089 RepID=UPI003C7A881A